MNVLRPTGRLAQALFAILVVGMSGLIPATQAQLLQAQTAHPLEAPELPAWLDRWRLSTFSFGTIGRDQNGRDYFEVIGTGFFVALDETTRYVVTAKRVFLDPGKHWHPEQLRIRFARQEHASVHDELGIPIKLRDESGRDLWSQLDNDSDIAAILSPLDLGANSPHAMFPQDFAVQNDLYEGAQIVVLGFPGIMGNEDLIDATFGTVKWTNPDSPLDGTFLVDANVFPSNRGGPVIGIPPGVTKYGTIPLRRKIKLLGLISRVPIQRILPGAPEPVFHMRVVGEISSAEPAAKILKLLNSLAPRR